MIDYTIGQDGIAILALNKPGSSVNLIDKEFIDSLEENVGKALNASEVKGLVLTSKKRDFMVGGDLKQLLAAKRAEDIIALANRLDAVLRKMETGGKPVAAAINGSALGGGFELCLACHYRVLLASDSVRVGLPEVTLGLLPGGGGTQRLPRLIGIQSALQALLEGKRYRPVQAMEMDMVHALADSEEQLIDLAKAWISNKGNPVQPWDEKNFKIPGGEVQTPGNVMVFGAAAGLMLKKTYGNYPAPHIIMNSVYEGLQMPFDRALSNESRHFAKCVTSPVAKNMIRTLFFSLNEANKGAARPKSVSEKVEITKIGVLGAGMMGAGIAYVSAQAGIDVVLKDVSVEAAEKGKSYSVKILGELLRKGRIDQAKMNEVLDRIKTTDNSNDVADCKIVIEAVFENRELKANVTRESEAAMDKMAVFASNTSTLPISGLADASVRPKNFIGLHFFSPVDKMPLVEIIKGKKTSDYAIALCVDYVMKIKKTPIVVNDGRGFYTSRVFKTYLFEGLELLAEGVLPAVIDNVGKSSGMPVGPLAISDEVSIELMYKINKQTEADTGKKYEGKAIEIISRFIEEFKRPGKKEGKGFYEYPENGKKYFWPRLSEYYPPQIEQPSAEEVKKRLLYTQALEAVRAFKENIITSPQDADVGSILGIGFPPYTGGVLSFIDWIGPDKFVKECRGLARKFGNRFNPPGLLVKMAKEGKSFY